MKYNFSDGFYFLLFFCPVVINAQNLEQIGKKNQVKISGSLFFKNAFYQAIGVDIRGIHIMVK